MKVKYTGTSDVQVFDADDLKKAGVEGFKKTSFNRGEAVEVPDEVGKVLTGNEGIFGPYSFEEAEDEAKAESKEVTPDKPEGDEVKAKKKS